VRVSSSGASEALALRVEAQARRIDLLEAKIDALVTERTEDRAEALSRAKAPKKAPG